MQIWNQDSDNEIDIKDIVSLGQLIQQCINLQYFQFLSNGGENGNDICFAVAKCFNESVQNVELEISYNTISRKGIQHICNGMINCIQLLDLHLELNYSCLCEISAQIIGKCVRKLFFLRRLILLLGNNEITNVGLLELTKGISDCKQMQYLKLNMRNNKITSQCSTNLGKHLANSSLSNLIIDMSYNFQDDIHKGFNQMSFEISNSMKLVEITWILTKGSYEGFKNIILKSQRLIKFKLFT